MIIGSIQEEEEEVNASFAKKDVDNPSADRIAPVVDPRREKEMEPTRSGKNIAVEFTVY